MATAFREPEEICEDSLVDLLTPNRTIPVRGYFTVSDTGTERRLDADTYVSVSVDLASQDLDFVGVGVPLTFTAKVAIRYAMTDDPTGELFRAECRAVRQLLVGITGDSCSDLDADGFACDSFTLDSTSSDFEGGENPVFAKTYTATLKGRNLQTTEA